MLKYDTNLQARQSLGQIERRGIRGGNLQAYGIYPMSTAYPAEYNADLHVAVDDGDEGSVETGFRVRWRLDPRPYTDEERAEKLAELKAAKLAEIKAAANAALEPLAAAYPDREVQSWPQQIAEATAYAANSAADVPLLRSMAAERPSLGDTVEDRVAELARRILANAAAWSTMAGPVIGKRQALEDAVGAVTTLEDVIGVVVDFTGAGSAETTTSPMASEADYAPIDSSAEAAS